MYVNLFFSALLSDGSDRYQKHHHSHQHHHRKHHHHRQRRHGVDTTEWSPSRALSHEKRKDAVSGVKLLLVLVEINQEELFQNSRIS